MSMTMVKRYCVLIPLLIATTFGSPSEAEGGTEVPVSSVPGVSHRSGHGWTPIVVRTMSG